jgi:hypothetical protein
MTSHQPLNDISNQFRGLSAAACKNSLKARTTNDEDTVSELGQLFYDQCQGDSAAAAQTTYQADQDYIIKQSLEIDATCKNLIGDRSKQHILPVIQSQKHADLYCISPQTVNKA